MWAAFDAGIAGTAFGVVPNDFIVFQAEGAGWTCADALAAIQAQLLCFGIVAVDTIQVAFLKEYHRAVTRPVHDAVRQNFVYGCAQH